MYIYIAGDMIDVTQPNASNNKRSSSSSNLSVKEEKTDKQDPNLKRIKERISNLE